MVIYDTANKHNSLIHELWDLCDADITSFPLVRAIRGINSALEQIIGELINADGTWQFDDTNYTDFPIGTYTLVNSQERYSFNDKFLQLIEVSVKNKNGDFQILRPIDQKEYSDLIPLAEAYETDGMPVAYDKVSDDTIDLFPAPDNGVSVTLASGLKIKFKRTASIFAMTDADTITSATSKQPGFASPFHIILAYMTAIPFCANYKKDRVAGYERKVIDLRAAIMKHYGRREKDKRKVATTRGINFR